VLRCRSGAPPPLAFRPVPVILLWAGPRTLRRVCFENRGKRSVETVEPKFVSQVTLAPAPWDDCNDQSNDQRSPAAYLLWGVHRERHVCGEAEHRGLVATAPSTSGRRAGIPSAPALSLRAITHRRRAGIPSAPRGPYLCAAITHRRVKAWIGASKGQRRVDNPTESREKKPCRTGAKFATLELPVRRQTHHENAKPRSWFLC
jgi:hypothetical protein